VMPDAGLNGAAIGGDAIARCVYESRAGRSGLRTAPFVQPSSKLLECPPHMAELESLLEKHDNSPKDSITSCLLLFVALDPAAADVRSPSLRDA